MKKGFSLLEMIMVIAIIGLLMSIFLPNFSSIHLKAKEASIKAILHALQMAVETYYVDFGAYPEGSEVAIIDIITQFKNANLNIKTPKNPFTGQTYTNADDSGKIIYQLDKDTNIYSIIGYGIQNEKEIDRISNE